ncbi:MAG: ThuA domain-containing protein [Pirellulales bacterium]|nr:ThuA domain-containing protein [Pirellulales bacterium]
MSDSHVSRRKFFMHSAHKTIGVSAGLAAWQACDLSRFALADEPKRTLRVCLVSGCPLYKSDESLAALEKYLTARDHVTCSRAFSRNKEELPGLENLDDADCMVLFTRRMQIDGEPLQRIKRFCRRGGAIVAIRTASHALQNWLELDKEVLGGDYDGHFSNPITQVKIVEEAKDHPVLAGVEPFASHGTLYKNAQVADDVTVLLAGSFPEHTHPVAWVRRRQGGRVFYTSLGHPDDFRQESFLRLLANAVEWTCDQQPR